MRLKHLDYLRCPKTKKKLFLEDAVEKEGRIFSGTLIEPESNNKYPIINFIPRFVNAENYSNNFGIEWNIHNKTQFDDYSKFNVSKERFEKETKWEKDLKGQTILEIGSGSGRFTKHAVETGAMVVSFDLSSAVEANYNSNGSAENLLIVQASAYEIPVEENYFDKAYCFGVLQHTPYPKDTFINIIRQVKPGGKIATDVYVKNLTKWFLMTKYYARPFTKNMNPGKLYKLCTNYINFIWPLVRIIRRIPKVGHVINWRLLVADYSHKLKDADDNLLKEWALLDTYDMLSPKYDYPQTLSTFRKWHFEAGLIDIDVKYGYNGVEGRGTKPLAN